MFSKIQFTNLAKDIEIVSLGIRPGEKQSEYLCDKSFVFSQTIHPEINKVVSDDILGSQSLNDTGDTLLDLTSHGETDRIMHFLKEKIPETSLNAETPDLTAITLRGIPPHPKVQSNRQELNRRGAINEVVQANWFHRPE